MKNDNAELIQRTLDGDQQAFNVLVEKYQKQIHALAWQKIGDFHIAQDIVQDTFLTAYQKLQTLTHHNQFVGWLYVITTNKCKNWKRKKRVPLQSIEATDPNEIEEAYYSEHITRQREEASNKNRRMIVEKLLSKLKESDRTIVNLYYIAEMTCEDIGKFLGVSTNTVRSRLHRARNQLKKEEAIIRENLSSFQLPPQLTENIMKEISRLNPVTPSGNKPLVPIAVSAASAILVLLLIGVGAQHLKHFQKPYSLNAMSKPTIEIVDAQLILDSPAKPSLRNQIGRSNIPDKSDSAGQKSDASLFAAAEADEAEVSKTKPEWVQTKGPQGGLINTLFSTTQGDIFAETTTNLYKLSDKGQRWRPVNTWQADSLKWTDWAIGGRRIVESKDTLYIVTYEEILASVDRGETWNSLGPHPENRPIGLTITDTGFYLGLADGVYRSVNGMTPWIPLKDGMEDKRITALAAVENTVFAGTSTGLYRLKTGVWEKLFINQTDKSEQNQVIHALGASENRIYVAAGTKFKNELKKHPQSMLTNDSWWSLYRSTDLGNSWYSIDPRKRLTNQNESKDELSIGFPPNGTNEALGATINIIAMKEKVMVAVPTELFYSINTGETWNYISLNDKTDIRIPPPILMLDRETLYRAGESGIFRTTDGGESWHQFNTGIVTTKVTKVIATGNRLFARTNDDFVTSTDGGESWKTLPIDGDSMFLMTEFNGDLFLKNSGTINTIFRLSTQNNKLTPIAEMPDLEEVNMVFPFPGATAPLMHYYGNFAVGNDTYYVEFGQKLFRWKPGTTRWYDTGVKDNYRSAGHFPFAHHKRADYSQGTPLHVSFESMGIKIAVSGNTVYVGKRDGQLMRSFNEGDTWTDVVPNLPYAVESCKSIVFAGEIVYVATDKGVVRSRTEFDWEAITDVEGENLVIKHLAVDGTTVYGHSDQKVYEVKEDSNVWNLITPEIPYPVSSLAAEGRTLYVGTLGGGVLRFDLNKQIR